MEFDNKPLDFWGSAARMPSSIDLSHFPMTCWIIKSDNNKHVYETVNGILGLCVFHSEAAALRYKNESITTLKAQAKNFPKNYLDNAIKSRESLNIVSASADDIKRILCWNRKAKGRSHFITEQFVNGIPESRNYITFYDDEAAAKYTANQMEEASMLEMSHHLLRSGHR